MFESIKFENFKTLRDTTLPLSPFTLIVGPNGSGKSTALSAFLALCNPGQLNQNRSVSVPPETPVILTAVWKEKSSVLSVQSQSLGANDSRGPSIRSDNPVIQPNLQNRVRAALQHAKIYSLDSTAIAAQVQLLPDMALANNGSNLAGVLDRLRDQSPERFKELNDQLGRWIPEFDQILFETPNPGHRAITLRTREGHHPIKAANLSQGTLIALALLTLAYVPNPPPIICLEEPDRGLHPRLLRDVRDAIYRLAYPDATEEKRSPVQVIATTHNPYFLDLFREHPEEIVIAEKVGLESKFSRLSDRKDLDEILGDAPLSEVWYSGVLGGVPVGT